MLHIDIIANTRKLSIPQNCGKLKTQKQSTGILESMKKHIEINITLANPSDVGLEEILKALDEFIDDTEHLLPKAELSIIYTQN